MPVHTVRFIIDCTCVRVCECVRFACCIFHYAKIAYHFFFWVLFSDFCLLFSKCIQHKLHVLVRASFVYRMQLHWGGFFSCAVSLPPLPIISTTFSGVFVAFAYVVLILIAWSVIHSFFFHISLRLRCTFSFRQVRVVCMLSPILSFVNTAIICVP